MNWLAELLPPLLYEGRLVFRQCPRTDATSHEAIRLLEAAFNAYRLDLAGRAIEFDAGTAVEAGSVLIRASWALVNHDTPSAEIVRWVAMSHPPTTPAHHLTADLLFRFLPQIRHRALATRTSDPLAVQIEALLRRWPLSGVLANLELGPDKPPELCGHPGLMRLYAERWARHQNPNWRPDEALNDYVDLVCRE